jgi:hypothetical protein
VRGWGVGEEEPNHTTARKPGASIKHSILFGSINTSFRNNNADIKSFCCKSAHCFFAKDLFLSQSSARYEKFTFFVNNRKISKNCFLLINMHAWLWSETLFLKTLSFNSRCLLYTVEINCGRHNSILKFTAL